MTLEGRNSQEQITPIVPLSQIKERATDLQVQDILPQVDSYSEKGVHYTINYVPYSYTVAGKKVTGQMQTRDFDGKYWAAGLPGEMPSSIVWMGADAQSVVSYPAIPGQYPVSFDLPYGKLSYTHGPFSPSDVKIDFASMDKVTEAFSEPLKNYLTHGVIAECTVGDSGKWNMDSCWGTTSHPKSVKSLKVLKAELHQDKSSVQDTTGVAGTPGATLDTYKYSIRLSISSVLNVDFPVYQGRDMVMRNEDSTFGTDDKPIVLEVGPGGGKNVSVQSIDDKGNNSSEAYIIPDTK